MLLILYQYMTRERERDGHWHQNEISESQMCCNTAPLKGIYACSRHVLFLA